MSALSEHSMSTQPASKSLSTNNNNNNMLPRINPGQFQIHVARPRIPEEALHANSPLHGMDNMSTAIQNTWAMFSAMMDSERNLLLRGLLDRCSTKQVEFICTALNLKSSEANPTGKVISLHPSEFAQKATSNNKKKNGKDAAAAAATSASIKYDRPWHSNVKSASPANKVAGMDRREMSPGRVFQGVTFDVVANEVAHGNLFKGNTESSNHTFVNQNTYMRLFNSQFDMEKIPQQMRVTKPEVSEKVMNFLTTGYKKLQNLLQYLYKISGETTPENSIKEVLKCVCETVGAKYVSIYLIEESTQDFLVSASNWHQMPKRMPCSSVFCGKSVLARNQCNMYNVKTSEDYTDEVDALYGGLDCECILSVPIVQANTRNIGILEVVNKENGSPYFSSDDEFILKSISYICTLLVIHNHIKPEQTKKADNIKMLLNTASMMTSELEIVDLVRVIMQKAIELISAERCSIFMVDEERQELWTTISSGSAQIRIPMTTGIAGFVATTGEVCNIPDAYADPRFNRAVDIKTGYRTRTILCMPMRNNSGRVVGVTQIINKLPENQMFSKEDEVILQSFSSLAAATVEKTVLFNSLQSALDKATFSKTFNNMVLKNSKNIVMILDAQGMMTSITRPSDLFIQAHHLHEFKTKAFDVWLGKENEDLVEDIRIVYKKGETVSGYYCGLRLADMLSFVNYRITPTTDYEDEEIKSHSQENLAKKFENPRGVIVEFEVLDNEAKSMETVSRYFKQSAVRECMAKNGIALKGIRQKVSIMVVDVRNFSSLVEYLNPTEVITLINDHFSNIQNALRQNDGALDKFMGDAVLSVFGTPFAGANDTKNAVTAALQVKAAVVAMNQKNMQNLSFPQLKVGIGISTGNMITGVVGSSTRKEYAVLGDGVNMAASIEKATKIYGTAIMVCDRTRHEVRDYFHMREIDTIEVKGRAKPIVVYEVLASTNTELQREVMTSLICFELGLAEYRQQNWTMAISHFSKAVHLADDAPSKTFISRCRAILDGRYEIPRDGWDFTWQYYY